ncbi:MAG: polysaccharide deacetylase family protein [Tannerella sp.]|jgi:hypothetical protein|nr:polysaccharide deacetylase family protein [Tannerella sp.]
MSDMIRYLIQFLLGEHISERIVNQIGYTSDADSFRKYKIVVIPSGFFDEKVYGTPDSVPALPLQIVEDIPLLFGKPLVERVGDVLVVHADIIASSYFLLSRYEEIIRRDVRDEHGRFPGQESLPFRADFIHRPIVDEYGRLLRKWLSQIGIQLPEPPQAIRHIYLTHDVDAPFACRLWRNVIRRAINGQSLCALIRNKFGALENDPYYTFPWLLEKDGQTKTVFGEENCNIYLFFKAGGNEKADKPHYDLYGKDIRKLYELLSGCACNIGLHSSYQAGKDPARIFKEKSLLEKAFLQDISANRHHFLAAREPEDLSVLEQAGITDDFTMGYADVAGFRLGTARPVRWINACKQIVSSLVLHPLLIMDSTLSESKYMGLTTGDALDYATLLIEQVRQVNGELVLLWHNTSVSEEKGEYHKILYSNILNRINENHHHYRRASAVYQSGHAQPGDYQP